MRQLSHSLDTKIEQLLCSRSAHEKQVADGQPPHLLLYLVLPKGMYPVRLLKVGCHLCQKLIFRNPDIDRKSQSIPDLILDPFRSALGAAPQSFRPAHIHECLVHGILLHIRRILPQYFHKRSRAFLVQPIIWRNQDQIRTFPLRLHDRFSGSDAIPLRRDRFRQDDPVPQRRVPAHCGDLLSKIRVPAQMVQTVHSLPA